MRLGLLPVLILRFAVAILFIHLGYTKVNNGWLSNSEPLKNSLSRFEQNAPPASKWYLEKIAKPGVQVWSKLICLGELALGISLLVGFLLRLSTFLGSFMVINFHVANGTLFSLSFFGSPWAILIIASLVVLNLTEAGRRFGLDALLARRKPRSIFY